MIPKEYRLVTRLDIRGDAACHYYVCLIHVPSGLSTEALSDSWRTSYQLAMADLKPRAELYGFVVDCPDCERTTCVVNPQVWYPLECGCKWRLCVLDGEMTIECLV